ncbi:MAG: UDP-N-acetylmuramoyl-L-alanine--D-glutamate ligase, partial [Clostridia bacterium]|nr:UDP-N-acetylmuramoyl-L-alanine--D-glutamate ligase [Clostridia bacterium]
AEDDVLVVNGGNEETIKIGECANARVKTFSAKQKALVHLNGDMICYGEEEVLNIKDIKIPGLHNVENYMTAICAVHDMVSLDTIRKVAKTFGGVQHRIELVRIKDGVKYYNSSIDSSPNRTINTLKVFPERVILITGGKDKGIPYDEIGPHIIDKVKTLVLIGATAPLIEDALNKAYAEQGITPFIDVFHAESYEQAVNLAYKNAKENDVVLLSPASTSFDMFKNFEERGNCFKELVMKL